MLVLAIGRHVQCPVRIAFELDDYPDLLLTSSKGYPSLWAAPLATPQLGGPVVVIRHNLAVLLPLPEFYEALSAVTLALSPPSVTAVPKHLFSRMYL